MVIVDTSVWIDHLRSRGPVLTELLLENQVACHPFVIGELACGNLGKRKEILNLLDTLPKAPLALDHEYLRFIELHRLWGMGLGFVDIHILASASLSGFTIMSTDKPLSAAASRLGLGYQR